MTVGLEEAVHTRAAALGEELGLDTAQAAQLCQKCPNILRVPTDTVVRGEWWRQCGWHWGCPGRRLCSCDSGPYWYFGDYPRQV